MSKPFKKKKSSLLSGQQDDAIEQMNSQRDRMQENGPSSEKQENEDMEANGSRQVDQAKLDHKHFKLLEQETPEKSRQIRVEDVERSGFNESNYFEKFDTSNNILNRSDSKGILETDVSITEWALRMGTPSDQLQVQSIEEQIKPREDDVYPLSIHYSKSQQFRMKIIRIAMFVLCFYFLIPFDLYITSHHRLYYYGTDVNSERISFTVDADTGAASSTFTLESFLHKQKFKKNSECYSWKLIRSARKYKILPRLTLAFCYFNVLDFVKDNMIPGGFKHRFIRFPSQFCPKSLNVGVNQLQSESAFGLKKRKQFSDRVWI